MVGPGKYKICSAHNTDHCVAPKCVEVSPPWLPCGQFRSEHLMDLLTFNACCSVHQAGLVDLLMESYQFGSPWV